MKNKEYLMKLLINKKPIRIYLLGEDLGIYTYDEEKNRYQGKFGYAGVKELIKCVNGDERFNHIQIEGV